jgi:hypothetical protein
MKTITYNLKENGTDYYKDIREFSGRVLDYFPQNFNSSYSEYVNYITANKVEPVRTFEEYVYDFLSAGVYLNIYSSYSNRSSSRLLKLQKSLYQLRRKNKSLKPYIDPLRGIISTAFLYNKNGNEEITSPLKEFSKLILWLEAAGEFREETKRFEIIHNFLRDCEQNYAADFISSIKKFGSWFESESIKRLGNYTRCVNNFIKEKHKKYRWKENYIFTGRERIEYHLSLVGAELMNEGFKKNFHETKKRALLVPACMRFKRDGKCKAAVNNFDMQCTGCSRDCSVNHLTKLGLQKNFSVHIIPHSSDFTTWLKTWAVGTNIGVIGVACPLNLITGGLELKSLDIPAQCVMLDYCGCSNHWDEKGFPTELNKTELLKILEDKN